jgi:hypothetical protein
MTNALLGNFARARNENRGGFAPLSEAQAPLEAIFFISYVESLIVGTRKKYARVCRCAIRARPCVRVRIRIAE